LEGASRITVGGLNIAASPHPPGIYERALRARVDFPIAIGGPDRAKITQRIARQIGPIKALFGQILVWTEIDKSGPWLNTKNNTEATESDKDGIVLPPNVKPNYRSFYYGLDEASHILVVEQQSERGNSFGPRRAEKFFRTLL
jgi:hypothetical protein